MHRQPRLLVAIVLLVLASTVLGSDARVALFHCSHDKRFLTNDYESSHRRALAEIRAAGYPCEPIESRSVAQGGLLKRGYRVLVLSYTGVMTDREAAGIREFCRRGGKVLDIYSGCRTDPTAQGAEQGECKIADVLAADAVRGTGGGSRCRYMEVLDPDHPVFRRLPVLIPNPHGYSVIMKPRPGTHVLARWLNADQQAASFRKEHNAAILESPSALYFAGYIWRFPDQRSILANMLAYLLGEEAPAGKQPKWPRPTEAERVTGGLNLEAQTGPDTRVDALGLPCTQNVHGLALSAFAVVYPHRSEAGLRHAERLAQRLAAPLVADVEAVRRDTAHGWGSVRSDYGLILVTRALDRRCDNMLCNMLRGIWPETEWMRGHAGAAMVRLAAKGAAGKRPMLVVAGNDATGLQRAVDVLAAAAPPLAAKPCVSVWQPRRPFGELVYPYTLPHDPIGNLSLTAAVNERGKVQFVVTPSRDCAPTLMRVQLAPVRTANGQTLPRRAVEILATRYILAQTTQCREPDPLEPFDKIELAPGRNQQIWLLLDLTGAKPGDYRSELAVSLPKLGIVHRLPVQVRVLPIVLAPRNHIPLSTCVWDYRAAGYIHGPSKVRKPTRQHALLRQWERHYQEHFRAHWRAYCDGLAAHGVNVMFFPPNCVLPQYQSHGQIVDEKLLTDFITYGKQIGFRHFIFTQILGQSSADPNTDEIDQARSPMFSPEWDTAYRRILSGYLNFTRRLGLSYSEWAVYPYDEPHTEHALKVVTHVADLIDQVDPRIQLWSDPTRPRRPADMVEFWRRMAQAIDIWCPHDGLVAPGSPGHTFARGLGEPVWFYRCGGYLHKRRPDRMPERYFRLFPWQALHRRLDGCGFWTYMGWLGDSWDDCDVATRAGDGGVVYEGKTGPVTSLNWEAWSHGIDDYKYLLALQQQIDRVRPTAQAKAAKAQELYDDAISKAIAGPAQLDAQRVRVREAILQLQHIK